MPAPLHVKLSSYQRGRLHELRRDPTLKSRERDRAEALLLSADGMRVSRLARHFGCCEATVRRWLHHFAADGPAIPASPTAGRGPTWPGARPCVGP